MTFTVTMTADATQAAIDQTDKWQKFAQAVLAGRPLALYAWAGPNGLFSIAEYRQLLSLLQRQGLVVQPGRFRPPVLTEAGLEALRQMAGGGGVTVYPEGGGE